jgi:hypothetical protein
VREGEGKEKKEEIKEECGAARGFRKQRGK